MSGIISDTDVPLPLIRPQRFVLGDGLRTIIKIPAIQYDAHTNRIRETKFPVFAFTNSSNEDFRAFNETYKNNQRENKRRIAFKYQPGQKVFILAQNRLDPKLKLHQGPFKIVSYDKMNGTLQIRRGNYIEPINVRLVRPFFQRWLDAFQSAFGRRLT